MRNIKIFQKGFNFNIFDKNTKNDNLENDKEIYEKNYLEKNTDTYNEIIKDKVRLEDNLSKELSLSAEAVYNYKIEIENEKKKLFALNSDINELKNKEYKINQDYDENIKRLDLLHLHYCLYHKFLICRQS